MARRKETIRSVLRAWVDSLDPPTQDHAGDLVGVTGENVGRWMSGDTIPSMSRAPQLAALLGRSLSSVRMLIAEAQAERRALSERVDALEQRMTALEAEVRRRRR